jgi:hypothetical protein
MLARLRRQPLRWLLLVITGAFVGAAGLTAHSLAQPPDLTFGPRLYLLLSPADDFPSLLPPTTVLHAHLHADLGGHYVSRYVASGGIDDQAIMEAAGLSVRLIDADTTNNVYYFADASAAQAESLASSFGEILYADNLVLLIAATPAVEQTMLDTLLANGVSVAALLPDPINVQPETLVSAAGATVQQQVGADPTIAGLLPLLTEGELSKLIDELDGDTQVLIDNQLTTLQTRYTLSTQMRLTERYLYQYYTALGMSPYYHEWTYGNYSGRNVIAEIRGTLRPERIWIVGGHSDTISESPYNRSPGADDNGTGTAATMLIAKILHNYRFAETIRFVHFSGEEQGQWGSKRYAAELAQSGAQVMGFLNLDMIGDDGNGDRRLELHTGLGTGSNALGDAFIQNNIDYAQGLVIERKTSSASRFSDHSPFWDRGYPAFLAIEDFFDNAVAGDRDRNPQYHRTGDRLNLVRVNYVARTARTTLATVAELAGLQGPNTGPTATATSAPTDTPTATPPAAGCTNLLLNPDFEINGSWQFGTTPYSAGYDSTVRYSGQRGLRLGIPAPVANRRAHSSAFQRVVIPADATEVTLRYWQRPGGSSDGVDYRETLLLNANYGFLATLERAFTVSGADQWSQKSFNLLAHRGRTVVVYFNVYNNGGGAQQWNYVDQAALIVCAPSIVVATPTAEPAVTETATPTATATLTATATVSVTPTLTVTPMLTVTPTITATPTLTVTPTITGSVPPTVTITPIETPTLAPTAPAGQASNLYLPLVGKP